MTQEYSSLVKAWMKRINRKGPFYLISSCEHSYGLLANPKIGKAYTVIWKENNKTKIGVFSDGMYARYGVATFGTLTGSDVTGLWQSRAGSVDLSQINSMIDVSLDYVDDYSIFELSQLKDISW